MTDKIQNKFIIGNLLLVHESFMCHFGACLSTYVRVCVRARVFVNMCVCECDRVCMCISVSTQMVKCVFFYSDYFSSVYPSNKSNKTEENMKR